MLISNTILCATALMKCKRGQYSTAELAKIFASLLNCRKMKEVLWFICERETSRLLLLDNIEEKSSKYIKDALYSKHLEAYDVPFDNIPSFEECLDHQDIVVELDIVEKVVKKVLGLHWLASIDTNTIST